MKLWFEFVVLSFLLIGASSLFGQVIDVKSKLSSQEQEFYNSLDSILKRKDLSFSEKAVQVSHFQSDTESQSSQTRQGIIAYHQATLFFHQYQIDSSFHYLTQAKFLLSTVDDRFCNTSLSALEGSIALVRQDFDFAETQLLRAEELGESLDHPLLKKIFIRLAAVYQSRLEITPTLYYYEKAMELCVATNDIPTQAAIYNNLGSLYLQIAEQDNALENYSKALALYQEHPNPRSSAMTLHNMGIIRQDQGELEEAKRFYEEALRIQHSLNKRDAIAAGNLSIASLEISRGNYYTADSIVAQVKNLIDSIGDSSILGQYYQVKGEMHYFKEEYELAEQSLQRIFKLPKSHNYYVSRHSAYQLLERISIAKGDFYNAYQYAIDRQAMADSLPDNEALREIHQAELRFLEREKVLEVEILQQQNQLQQLKIERQRIMQRVFIILFILALLSLISIFYFYRIAKRQNAVVTDQNERLQALNEALVRSDDRNREVIKSLENFAYIAAHDLKAPIRNANNFTEFFSRKNKGNFDETDKEYFNIIRKSLKWLTKMIEDLLSLSKLDQDLPPLETIDLSVVIQTVSTRLEGVIDRTKTQIHFHSGQIFVKGHQTLLNQVFQNIIDNAIRHAPEGRKPIVHINCSFTDDKNFVLCQVSDNGDGIMMEKQDAIFELFSGGSIGKSTGIGLATCKKIVNHYGGKIGVRNNEEGGATVSFSLPAAND